MLDVIKAIDRARAENRKSDARIFEELAFKLLKNDLGYRSNRLQGDTEQMVFLRSARIDGES